MRLTFQLRFHTIPGQSLLLTGNHEILGNDDPASAIPLDYLNDQFWRVRIVIPKSVVPDAEITYRYILRLEDGSMVEDWGNGRVINPVSLKANETLLIDSWNNPGFYENAFYTEPFRAILLAPRHSEVCLSRPKPVTHCFKVKAPLLHKDQTLCLIGNTTGLGNPCC
jgi:4-alpha-glucanotransferase